MYEKLITEARELCAKISTRAKILRRDARDIGDGLIALGTDKDMLITAETAESAATLLPEMADALEKAEAALKAYKPYEPCDYNGLHAELEKEKQYRADAEKTAQELMAELATLREAGRRIPVSERMPERYEHVLVFSPLWVYPILAMLRDDDEFWTGSQAVTPTHWMPLPAAPDHIVDANKMVPTHDCTTCCGCEVEPEQTIMGCAHWVPKPAAPERKGE